MQRSRRSDGGIDPGPCDPGEISNDANAWIVQALCPRAGMQSLNVDLGEREDRATTRASTLRVRPCSAATALDRPQHGRLRRTRLLGGGGNDELAARTGNDVVDGGVGATTCSTAGAGDDELRDADGLRPTRIRCGPGADRVDADQLDDMVDCETVASTVTAPPPDAG